MTAAAPSRQVGVRSAERSRAPREDLAGTEGAGWAVVREGPVLLGTTPLRMELPPGEHVLTVSPYGTGAEKPVRVRIISGQVTKLHLDL